MKEPQERKNIFQKLNREDFIEAFAVLIYISAIGFAWAVTFIEIPEANQRNADTVLGFLMGSALTAVINHLFNKPKEKTSYDTNEEGRDIS